MRLPHRQLLALLLLSPAAVIPACGSSSSNNPGPPAPAGGNDAGGADATVSPPGKDSGGGAPAPDAGGSKGDAGIFGDNCPAFDGGAFAEAPHGPFPTLRYYGGGILQAPQIITFTFPTTPGVATLQSFGQTVTQTPWFAAITKDFCINDGGTCIGPGPAGVSVAITTAAAPLYVDMMGQGTSTTGVDLDTFINQQIAAAVTAKTIPAPGPNSLYAFYFPPSSSISMGPPSAGGGASCQAFGGYHNNITYTDGKTQIVYAIMPDCASGDAKADLENVTVAASHEIAEATTDPFVGGNNTVGWYLDQPDTDAGPTTAQIRNDPWATAGSFGEIGDNCESILDSIWTLDSGVLVQRIWSPFAASQGKNPCIPVPASESYYNTSTDKVLYVADVGTSFTVDLTAFSDRARDSWRLDAIDQTPTQTNTQYLKLEFVGEVDGGDGVSHLTCVNNKTTGQLKVTLLADPSKDTTLQQEWPEADGVIYSADVDRWSYAPLPDGGQVQQFPYQFWPFAVVTPAVAASIGVTDAGVVDAKKLAGLRASHAQPPRGVMRPGRFPFGK